MLYIINGTIHFRNTDGALWEEDENSPSSITLTATTSRLLTFLLERHGDVASRDDILENVWINYGLRSSSNSLNKYIADLRKILSNFDIQEEVIITVPKVGFIFSRHIDVEKEQTSSDYVPPIIEGSVSKNEGSATGEIIKKPSRKWWPAALGIVALGVVPILLSKTNFGYRFYNLFTQNQNSYYLLGKIEQCDIYTLKQSSTEMTETKLNIAKKLVSMSGLSCIKNTRFYYQPSDPIVYGYPGRFFLARCTINKDAPQEFAACENYYGANFINE